MKNGINADSGNWELKVDSISDMIIFNMKVNGNLTVGGFYLVEPYIQFYFTRGAISITNARGYVGRNDISLTTSGAATLFTISHMQPVPHEMI